MYYKTCKAGLHKTVKIMLHAAQMGEAGLEKEVDAAELAAKIVEGLRQLRVFSQTGAGQAALRAHAGARELVRSAMRNRREACSPAQQAAMEGLVKASTVRLLALLQI